MVRITCINKEEGDHYDPHEGITRFGWVNEDTHATGNNSREEMIAFLERDRGQAFVRDALGRIAWLVVRVSRYGNKYLKTLADGRDTDNLLFLSECGR